MEYWDRTHLGDVQGMSPIYYTISQAYFAIPFEKVLAEHACVSVTLFVSVCVFVSLYVCVLGQRKDLECFERPAEVPTLFPSSLLPASCLLKMKVKELVWA